MMGGDEQKVGWIDHLAWVHFGHKTLLCGDQIAIILGRLAPASVMQPQPVCRRNVNRRILNLAMCKTGCIAS